MTKKKKIEYLRNLWGKPTEKYRNFDLIELYYVNSVAESGNDIVDNKTWSDLDFDRIFSKMDRTLSPIGQQYLYHLLHKYEQSEAVLKKRFQSISLLKNNPLVRETIQTELLNLHDNKNYFISSLITGELPARNKYFYLLILSAVLTLLSSVLIIFQPYFLAVTLFLRPCRLR